MTLRDTALSAALFIISDIWDVNIVVGHEVQGQVNGTFRQAPLGEILDLILLSNGYGYRSVGQSLLVMPIAELGDLNPMFQTATIAIRSADPADVLEGVRLLSSPHGKVQAVPSAKSLIVIDFAERVAMVRQFVESLDEAAAQTATSGATGDAGPIRVVQFTPQFVAAESLKTSVETVLSSDGKAAAVTPDNYLIVADHEPQLELAQQVMEKLDVSRRQVRITALIYDLDVKDIERLGINWNHALKGRNDGQGNPQSVFQIDSLLSVPVGANLPDGVMTFMNLAPNFDITAVVQALQEAEDSRLLADPNVTVLDHEQATMSIVTEIPYQQLTQTQQGGQIGTTDFREAGVKLVVTPHIAADGTIRMEVEPSFSRLSGFTQGEQAQPIIDRREAKTTVRVSDRQVLIIGGLRQRNDTGDFLGLPYLKDIEFLRLGHLFRSRNTEVRESELLVFIMPEIVPTANVGSYRESVGWQYGQCLLDQVPQAAGGAPPRRPQPCIPPVPIGGHRVLGTPYQPDCCPLPSVETTEEPSLHAPPVLPTFGAATRPDPQLPALAIREHQSAWPRAAPRLTSAPPVPPARQPSPTDYSASNGSSGAVEEQSAATTTVPAVTGDRQPENGGATQRSRKSLYELFHVWK